MASSGPDEFDVSTRELDAIPQDAEFFRSLVEHGSDAIISISEDSTIVYANKSVQQIFGYTPDELIGEKLTVLMPDRFHSMHFEAVDTYLETGERTLDWNSIELPAQHRDGQEIPLSITFEEHSYEGQRIFSGIMRDISERKSHEENLKSLQRVVQELMHIRDPDDIARRIVTTATETLALPLICVFRYDDSTDQLHPVAQSERMTEILDESPALDENTLVWEAYQANEPRQYNDSSDSERHSLGSAEHIKSLYATPLNCFGCLVVADTDPQAFDDRTLSLVQILAANAEAAFERAEREAERERQRQRFERFASMVSHDLRDPLQTARATAAVAQAGNEEAFDELNEIFTRMDQLIEDVLVLAKQGESVGETEPVDIDTVAEDAWHTVETANATLQIEDASTVMADPERLRTILENLFRNAVDHAGPDVTVSLGPLPDRAGFYVADDGPGFGDANADELFEYGYTTQGDNTGFGLHIVAEIVDAHGWDITPTASTTGGARFDITTQ